MIKVKICGITNLEDARLASSLGADALGFIFTRKSPRCITQAAVKKIIPALDPYLTTVGVFLDEEKEKAWDIATALNLDAVQFHGNESWEYCHYFRQRFRVIKAIFPDNYSFIPSLSRYRVDAFLFDIPYEQKLRGVKTLSPQALKAIAQLIRAQTRVIISGGLTVDNVQRAIRLKPYAVDVTSGVEAMVGKKDPNALRFFIQRVKQFSP